MFSSLHHNTTICMSNSVSCMLLVTWNKLHLFKLLLLLLYYYYSLYYCNSALVETNVNWLFYRQYINETYIYTYIHTLYILISSTFFSVRLHQVLYLPIKIRVGVPISLVMKISLVHVNWKICPILTPYLFPHMTSPSASFPLFRTSSSTFPLDAWTIYHLNWINCPPSQRASINGNYFVIVIKTWKPM